LSNHYNLPVKIRKNENNLKLKRISTRNVTFYFAWTAAPIVPLFTTQAAPELDSTFLVLQYWAVEFSMPFFPTMAAKVF
jgi:hypothetical protein